jgi:hypothetical protein
MVNLKFYRQFVVLMENIVVPRELPVMYLLGNVIVRMDSQFDGSKK